MRCSAAQRRTQEYVDFIQYHGAAVLKLERPLCHKLVEASRGPHHHVYALFQQEMRLAVRGCRLRSRAQNMIRCVLLASLRQQVG